MNGDALEVLIEADAACYAAWVGRKAWTIETCEYHDGTWHGRRRPMGRAAE